MSQILDCYHNDITQLVEDRILARLNRKWFKRRRYERRRDRMRHVVDANVLKILGLL